MALTRIVDTDDSGSGTDGTIHTNAWLQTINNSIDARWSEITVTATGTQNNLSITSSSIEADVVRCNNASDLTITGIAAPASPVKDGKSLVILAAGAGHVFLVNNSGSSSVGNRLGNFAQSANTPLAAGVGRAIYRYSVSASAWLIVAHDQGAAITATFDDAHFTGAGTDGNWALAAGDRTTLTYFLRGRQLSISWYLVTTTVANTPATLRIVAGAWGGFTSAITKLRPCVYDDNAGGNTTGFCQINSSGSELNITKLNGGTFANSTNQTATYGDIDFTVN